MASATIPVDLRNPGQVFACLGLMEAAEILCGPCVGGFDYESSETQTTFTLNAEGESDPLASVLGFFSHAKVRALAPPASGLSTAKWSVDTIEQGGTTGEADRSDLGVEFPSPQPDSPAALPIILTSGDSVITVQHWADDFESSGRDNVKLWAGAAGYPGAALARDFVQDIAALGDDALAAAAADPFNVSSPQSSSFRFDWRRDYIPLDAGFSPNLQGSVSMVGYPLVELLAAIGLQNARPDRPTRRDKLTYRYGVSSSVLPTLFARAVLGAVDLGFPMRVFRMRLGWPGQEGQARCIVDAQEEFAP